MNFESQTTDAGCWVFSFQWFCPGSSDLNPEKGEEGSRQKTECWLQNQPRTQRAGRHGKKETAPPDWEVEGLRSRGLTYKACPECKAGRLPHLPP